MAREILSKRNFFDFESPDSAISRFPMTLMKSMASLHQGNVVLAYLMEKSKTEKFNFTEHIFNVEAHAEHTGWHSCYEVSEIGTVTFRLPLLFLDDFFFSLVWCIVGCRIPSDEILRKNTKQKQ
jgi:hypothetical protein